MSKPQLKDTSMDMMMTGYLIKRLVSESGYTVSEVQNRLGLSCPQPIYRWCKGQNLPSLDNLFILSGMLGLHMEDFLMQKDEKLCIAVVSESGDREKRVLFYNKRIFEASS